MRTYIYLLAICASFLHMGSASAATWSQRAFHGQYVSWVEVNSRHSEQLAAQVEGVLRVSNDAGLNWVNRDTPAPVLSVKFDPVITGKFYIATMDGLYSGDLSSYDWTPIDQEAIGGSRVVSLVVSVDGVYGVAAGDGQLGRVFSLVSGSQRITELASSVHDPRIVAYSQSSHRLYAAGLQEVFSSSDGGDSWSQLVTVGSIPDIRSIQPGQYDIKILTSDYLYSLGHDSGRLNVLMSVSSAGASDMGRSAEARNAGIISDAGGLVYVAPGNYGVMNVLAHRGGAGHDLALPRFPVQISGKSDAVWVATVDGLWFAGDVSDHAYAKPMRPVVVIPGMLGSWPTPRSIGVAALGVLGFSSRSTALTLDPFRHTYDGLLAYLRLRGYEDGKTLFTFPYEWRNDNSLTAARVGGLVADIRVVCGCSKVDLVAHSMGGLVARSYIEGAGYRSDVDHLIQIAAPNAGSVSNYEVYESGFIRIKGVLGSLARVAFSAEAALHGYSHLAPYIRDRVLSVGQLLPVLDYIQGRLYRWEGPYNLWLADLNSDAGIGRLSSRVKTTSIASGSESTPSRLVVGQRNPGAANWPDGSVESVETSPGDGTVTLESAAWTGGLVQTRGDHGGILNEAATLAQLGYILLGDAGPALTATVSTYDNYVAVAVRGAGISVDVPGSPGRGGGDGAPVDRLIVPLRALDAGATITVDGGPGQQYELWYSVSSSDEVHHITASVGRSGLSGYIFREREGLLAPTDQGGGGPASPARAALVRAASGDTRAAQGLAEGGWLAANIAYGRDAGVRFEVRSRDGPAGWRRRSRGGWIGATALLLIAMISMVAFLRLRR